MLIAWAPNALPLAPFTDAHTRRGRPTYASEFDTLFWRASFSFIRHSTARFVDAGIGSRPKAGDAAHCRRQLDARHDAALMLQSIHC